MNASQSSHLGDFTHQGGAENSGSTPAARILGVAEKLFLNKGYNATTIREIAAASKVSNATIVKHFGGKPELFVCMVAEATKRLIGATAIDFADLPEQGLRTWGTAALRLLLEPRMVMAAQHLYSDVSMLPKLAQAYYTTGPATLATNLSLQLKRWADLGQLPDQDFLAAAEWFMHLLSGGVYHRVLIGLQIAPGLPPDVLHHPLSRGLHRQFFQGGLGLHLRSFVTTTKPQPSLNHNLKSVPLVLTGDTLWVEPDTGLRARLAGTPALDAAEQVVHLLNQPAGAVSRQEWRAARSALQSLPDLDVTQSATVTIVVSLAWDIGKMPAALSDTISAFMAGEQRISDARVPWTPEDEERYSAVAQPVIAEVMAELGPRPTEPEEIAKYHAELGDKFGARMIALEPDLHKLSTVRMGYFTEMYKILPARLYAALQTAIGQSIQP